MDWFKKHVDTVVVLGGILSCVIWMNGKFNDVDKRFNEVDQRFSLMEKDMVMIKTVLIMRDIIPRELAKNTQETGNN